MTHVDQQAMFEATPDDAQALSQVEITSADKWPGKLSEMLAVLESAYGRRGMDARAAFDLAVFTVLQLSQHMGGRQYYLPTGQTLHKAVRDAEAWRRYTGRNIEEIAEFLACTVTQAYNVIARQRALNVGKLQGKLFDA